MFFVALRHLLVLRTHIHPRRGRLYELLHTRGEEVLVLKEKSAHKARVEPPGGLQIPKQDIGHAATLPHRRCTLGPPMTAEIPDSLAALARDVAAWDGTDEAAAAFRARLPLLPALKGPPNTPDEGFLARINGLYRKREPIGIGEALKEAGAKLRAPFIGDPQMGAWPFHDALYVDDDAAAQWLSVFSSPHVIDEPLRAFVRTMFAARRRELWVPAAEVLGGQARRDERSRAFLEQTWNECFPKGLPALWPAGALLPKGTKADSHFARHLLSAACAFVVQGGDLPGFDARRLASLAPPTDSADASAVLLALAVLQRADAYRPDVADWLTRHATAIPMDAQCDEALRAHLSHAHTAEVASALRSRLLDPKWSAAKGMHALDALLSWLETARWFAARGDNEAVDQIRAQAHGATPALALALGQAASDPLARVLALLPVAMDPDVYATTPKAIPLLAELITLLSQPALADLPWRPLVSRAMGPASGARAAEGTVAERALGDLAVELTERGLYVGTLYRGRWYTIDDVMRFASSKAMATQVGVQMERLLRRCATPEHAAPGGKFAGAESTEERQIRLLWRLLRADPPGEAFREIKRVARGNATPLQALIAAVEHVDAVRHTDALCDACRNLADKAAELVAGGNGDRGVVTTLRSLVAVLQTAGPSRPGVASPAEALRRLRWQAELMRALVDWARWWGAAGEEIEAAWATLHRALETCLRPQHLPDLDELRDVEAALATMSDAIAVLVWPEAKLVNDEIDLWRGWTTRARERAKSAARSAVRVREALDRGDEAACVALLGEAERQTIADVPPADVRRLHSFFLHHWLFAEAKELAATAAGELDLPPVRRFLAMTFLGVAAGPIFVVDFGLVFNSVLLPGREMAFAATVLLCAAGTLAVLGTAVRSTPADGGIAGQSGQAPGAGIGAWLRRVRGSGEVKTRRAAGVWALTYVEAMVLSVLFLEILGNNPDLRTLDGVALPWLPQVLLWTSLSQFFGLFIGVIVAGLRVGSEEAGA